MSSPVRESSLPAGKDSGGSGDSGSRGISNAPASTVVTPELEGDEGLVLRLSLYHDVAEERMEAKSSDAVVKDDESPPASAGRRGGRSGCCGFGEKVKRWASRLPMDKIKILVVVWQILTTFPSVTAVDFPPFYARFLSWINIVNFNLGNMFSASCVLPVMDFYQVLLLTTLSPIALAATLAVTYWVAKHKAGGGSAGSAMVRAAWSRHIAAGLLLSFVVFTPTSTTAFMTFVCDEEAVKGESYLRADYNVSCNTSKHVWYQVYALVMIAVYPIGIPLLYAIVLWKNRHFLNPAAVQANVGLGVEEGRRTRMFSRGNIMSDEDLTERLRKRWENPDLVPSMFLWKDFDPDLYYYEVIECGRRILLTGVLIFIAPNTPGQAAAACIFAFGSLMGFELLRPHLDPTDSWLYRLGCVVIFMSNFLALLIRVDAAGETNRAVLGVVLVVVNVLLFLAVIAATWFSTQQTMNDLREGQSVCAIAGKVGAAKVLAADDMLTPSASRSSEGVNAERRFRQS